MNLYYNCFSYFDSLMMDYIFGLVVFYKADIGFYKLYSWWLYKIEKELYAPFSFIMDIEL